MAVRVNFIPWVSQNVIPSIFIRKLSGHQTTILANLSGLSGIEDFVHVSTTRRKKTRIKRHSSVCDSKEHRRRQQRIYSRLLLIRFSSADYHRSTNVVVIFRFYTISPVVSRLRIICSRLTVYFTSSLFASFSSTSPSLLPSSNTFILLVTNRPYFLGLFHIIVIVIIIT